MDEIQKCIGDYSYKLTYDVISPEAVHAAKVRIIDTLGALIGGFYGEPCQIARRMAVKTPCARGATVIGTQMLTTLEMAAFANGTTARYVELTDTYHWPGSFDGHPSDVIGPLIAAAEVSQASGRELITAVVLAYEIYIRFCDIFDNPGFDHTNFCTVAVASAASRLLHLTEGQLLEALSMAVVSSNVLRQTRLGNLSMFKGAASGHAGSAGLFAVQLAQAGMEGPRMPFQGKAGWCNHVAGKQFSFDTMGGASAPFKILDTSIKQRPCSGPTIPVTLAAEKLATGLGNIKEVKKITVELYRKAIEWAGIGAHHWDPQSRETADHSAPYVVAATLMDGGITPHSYDAAHLSNPNLRALMQKVVVVENEDFTQAYKRFPVEHHARVTVIMNDGQRHVGETGGDKDDLSAQLSDVEIEKKFRGLSEEFIGSQRATAALECLWGLDTVENTAVIPSLFVIDEASQSRRG